MWFGTLVFIAFVWFVGEQKLDLEQPEGLQKVNEIRLKDLYKVAAVALWSTTLRPRLSTANCQLPEIPTQKLLSEVLSSKFSRSGTRGACQSACFVALSSKSQAIGCGTVSASKGYFFHLKSHPMIQKLVHHRLAFQY